MTSRGSLAMATAVAAACLVACLAAPAAAQQPAQSNQADAVAQLLARVTALERQVRDLEAKLAGGAAPAQAPPPSAEPAAPDAMPEMPSGIGTRMQIHGFADANFVKKAGVPSTFSLGQMDLFMNSRLASNLNFMGEVVFEAGEDNVYGVDVERLLINYTPNDAFNLAVGRYHTAIGFYNTSYHHGTWFQTATGRPFIFRFEDDGGPLPVHGVGVSASGAIPSGRLGLRYIAEVSNGRPGDSSLEAVQNVQDENGRKAFNFAIQAHPDWASGLRTGVSVYRDRLSRPKGLSLDETIIAGYVVYQTALFEQLNEVIVMRHSSDDGRPAMTTTGFYTQISRQFGRARPYFRYDFFDAPEGDPLTGALGRRIEPLFGLRYDLGTLAAVKAEYGRLYRRPAAASNGVTLQFTFTF